MPHTTEITVSAAQYADHDDCLAAAATDYAEENELESWQVEASWADDANRETIILTVPAYRVTNCAGGTEGSYPTEVKALIALLEMQFPGSVYAPNGSEVDSSGWELDADGRLVSCDDVVTIETMPDHLRDAHRAARNWGRWPANGAERRRVSRDEADEIVHADPDGYDHIVA